ncbi:T9SS type B sorting domain-containing protein [Polaribacter pectinis]|uniref:T9SS type B sorting domain-containing protein n=1 Tax=Polaribacter pectinis TaxID=2738844 RepID=A0A7G9LEQ8_9FLAO|nr:T9SS type B sorting domain-containing protein [Polaribacter pectinis]
MLLTFFQLNSQTNKPPVLTATGRQVFCPQSQINIVTDFTITDEDDTELSSFFIQISAGYQSGFDELSLTGNHPTINSDWNATEGKLSLTGIGTSKILLTDLEKAVKEVVFSTTATTITEDKFFSLTIGDANYLPSTDHFYEFISDLSITWSDARIAAENRTYYGRQGYLATLTSAEEAQFAGEQASGAGWIGGSDEETEGVWKWVTGPEAGTIFWNGQVNGTTPNYANWNNNEPNDHREDNTTGEDYAHITDPSIGIVGAWNDLPNIGGTDLYIPKGYIVEYGKPSDPVLNIVATTSIYIPKIDSTTDASVCETGSATINAIPTEGQVLWYDAQTGGTLLFAGNDFTTPVLTSSTTYYATVSVNGCNTFERKPVMVTVIQRPTITSTSNDLICSGSANLAAQTSDGSVFWYDSLTSTTPIFTGNNFKTPNLTATTSYYVEARYFDCKSSSRTEVIAELDTRIPEFDLVESEYVLCKDIGSITLETENSQDNYVYQWFKEGEVIAGNSASISINTSGNYSVKAISIAGCESKPKTILVNDSEIATITKEDILIIDDSNNNSIQIINTNLGIGEYQFSIDDKFGSYKDVGFFENISTGTHVLFIKDMGGCGIIEYTFSILEYPKFFTPNNDGKNDMWNIKGYNKDQYTVTDIYIYNRFGVLIYKIDAGSSGWNGTYNGKKLPPNSYWFQTILTDKNGLSVEKKGSISLIRN